jgi:L-iditol 2-dehydrogenase
MKALVYTGPHAMDWREADDPEPGDGEALIAVEAVGICGSDMHAWHGSDERRPAPLILGHEATGIVKTGALAGKRVTVNPLVTCMTCGCCTSGRTNLCPDRQIISMPPREGAFAELLAMPERNLVEVPDEIDVQTAALAEPIACSWHAVRLAEKTLQLPLADARAVILGGGAIGLGAALVLCAFGCADIWIAETNPRRHGTLRGAGAFKVYDPLNEAGSQAGSAEVIVDAFGGEATRAAACALARPGGVIVHIGLAGGAPGLDVRRMTLQEITFIGTYTYTMQDFRDTAAAIFDGRLGALDWIEERALKDGAAAFDDINAGRVAAPKIVLNPQG